MTTKKPRRQFTDEFKADAVQLVIRGGRPIAQVARVLEINESSLGYWVKNYRQAHPDPQTEPAPVDAARYARLEAENPRLAEENAFLKKPRPSSRRSSSRREVPTDPQGEGQVHDRPYGTLKRDCNSKCVTGIFLFSSLSRLASGQRK